MPHYGAIYVARTERAGRAVFKVGQTRSSVRKRVAALHAAEAEGEHYVEIGHVVVTDVDRAARAFRSRQGAHGESGPACAEQEELGALLSLVRAACAPFMVADNLPESRGSAGAAAVEQIFDDTIARLEREKQVSADRAESSFVAIQDAVTTLAEACEKLAGKLSDLRERIDLEISPRVDRRAVEERGSAHHIICRVVLRAPVRIPAQANGIEYKVMRFRPLDPLRANAIQEPYVEDDGVYAVIELGVEISPERDLRFTIVPSTIELRGGRERGRFRRRLLAPLNTRAYLDDLEAAKTAFVQIVAANTHQMPDAVERGYFEERAGEDQRRGYYGRGLTRYYRRENMRFREYWPNEADCGLDTRLLRPYLHEESADAVESR